MKRVYICSRYAGDVARNTATAERICRQSAVARGCAPFAPHLLYTRFLDDEKASEREAGIACGLAFMEVCDEVWVFTGEGISDGMRLEVDYARYLGKPIIELDMIDLDMDDYLDFQYNPGPVQRQLAWRNQTKPIDRNADFRALVARARREFRWPKSYCAGRLNVPIPTFDSWMLPATSKGYRPVNPLAQELLSRILDEEAERRRREEQ